MNKPLVSIIVTCRKDSSYILCLFESILLQNISAHIEVILIDEDNEEILKSIVDRYMDKGVKIVYLSTNRYCNKEIQIVGLKKAQGESVLFVDASSVIWGTDVLDRHIRLMLREQADILQFCVVTINDDNDFQQEKTSLRPIAPYLVGADLFASFVRCLPKGFSLLGKLYARSLVLDALAELSSAGIEVSGNDFLLVSCLLWRAKKYLGSELVGCGMHRVDGNGIEAGNVVVNNYRVLQELVPHLERQGCSSALCENFSIYLRCNTIKNMELFCSALNKLEYPRIPTSVISSLLKYSDAETIFKAIISVSQIDELNRMKKKNKSLHKKIKKLSLG